MGAILTRNPHGVISKRSADSLTLQMKWSAGQQQVPVSAPSSTLVEDNNLAGFFATGGFLGNGGRGLFPAGLGLSLGRGGLQK